MAVSAKHTSGTTVNFETFWRISSTNCAANRVLSTKRRELKLCKQPFLTQVVPAISDKGDTHDEDLQNGIIEKKVYKKVLSSAKKVAASGLVFR